MQVTIDKEEMKKLRDILTPNESIRIPVGCAACGGPYPDCCSSCPIFDD